MLRPPYIYHVVTSKIYLSVIGHILCYKLVCIDSLGPKLQITPYIGLCISSICVHIIAMWSRVAVYEYSCFSVLVIVGRIANARDRVFCSCTRTLLLLF